ncbi:phosphodiesterase [Halobacteriales archaeon QH_8_64_26]|nr:MAG: phosphodiesterase [Halobacteriales archaeon QH_8_64_26]
MDDTTTSDTDRTDGAEGTDGTDATNRAFVLGLDGIPWNLIKRWASAGELPHFAELLENGAAGTLESTRPANTALAWPSIATGVWPDKHGVYSFRGLLPEYRHRLNTGNDVSRPALWEMASPAVAGNVPMTYPASEIDGTMVTGMLSPAIDERATHPPEFHRELKNRIPEYRTGLDWNKYRDRPGEFPPALASLLSARKRLMRLLMERDWRLFFFVYTEPDRLQHLLWDEEVLLDHYKDLDAILGEVLAQADEGTTVYVVSDHGFAPIEKYVYVNTILREEGFLFEKDETGTRSTLSRVGLSKSRVMNLLSRVGIDDDDLVSVLPRSLVERVADRIPGGHELHDVDYTRTEAFVHGSGNLYINDAERFATGPVDPADREAKKRAVAEALIRVTDPATGEKALIVHDGADLFPTDDRSPDLVLEAAEGYKPSLGLYDTRFSAEGVHDADHHPEGIFFAYGPDVASGSRPADAAVVDVAPTVLHGLGEAIPHDTDGRVLSEVFADGSPTAERPIATREYAAEARTGDPADGSGSGPGRGEADEAVAEEDFEDVENRLRGLGYLE